MYARSRESLRAFSCPTSSDSARNDHDGESLGARVAIDYDRHTVEMAVYDTFDMTTATGDSGGTRYLNYAFIIT